MSAWRLLLSLDIDAEADDPTHHRPLARQYALEAAIAEAVAEGRAPPTVWIWRPAEGLALGRFDSRLPRFREAVRALDAQGVELVRRSSGGQAVWQSPEFVNVSVFAPVRGRPRPGVPEAYRRYTQGLVAALARLSLKAEFQHVEGAFCDGPYDLAVDGKKLVGTAQVQKRGVVLVHGTMPVWGGLEGMLYWVSRFYALAGRPVRLERDAMATLQELLERDLSQDELVEALVLGHEEALGPLVLEEPSEHERARAGALLARVRVQPDG